MDSESEGVGRGLQFFRVCTLTNLIKSLVSVHRPKSFCDASGQKKTNVRNVTVSCCVSCIYKRDGKKEVESTISHIQTRSKGEFKCDCMVDTISAQRQDWH